MYHLHRLIKNGCVVKADDGAYRLGLNGLRYVHSVNNGNLMPYLEPKLIAIIVLFDSRGEVLLACRHKNPYINRYLFTGGRQHLGETPEAHAERELHEKTGLSNIELQHRGLVDTRIRNPEGELITHVVGHVYTGLYDGQAPEDNEYWSFSWHDSDDLLGKRIPLLPGTAELYAALRDHASEKFFLSNDFEFDEAK